MKPPVFIGSSRESESYVKIIEKELSQDLAIDKWYDGFFDPGTVTYEQLFRKSICYKYAIFVGGKDDLVERISTGEKSIKIRDNVYYELGLYAGILSPNRVFFFVHKDAKIATDFEGFTCLMFKDEQDVVKGCKTVLSQIKRKENESQVTLLPTVPQAVNYFNNYVKPVCEKLAIRSFVKIKRKDYYIKPNQSKLKIVFPDDLSLNWREYAKYYYSTNDYSIVRIKASYREFDVYARKNRIKKDKVFEGCMSVDAMTIVYDVIHAVMATGTLNATVDEQQARLKEARVFYSTLKKLVEENVYTKKLVEIVEPVWMKA